MRRLGGDEKVHMGQGRKKMGFGTMVFVWSVGVLRLRDRNWVLGRGLDVNVRVVAGASEWRDRDSAASEGC